MQSEIVNIPPTLDITVSKLEAWLETMRNTAGYGGPVVHWWQQSLVYTGPGLDWRYEGIIIGYLTLWQRTGEGRWLDKACRAGDDLLAGQLANGHYPASSFESNLATAGTPHEAACDVGLLQLALALRDARKNGWSKYAICAERNLKLFYIAQLWDASVKAFRDDPRTPSFVPNKAATVCEAFFLLTELGGEAGWVKRYVLPTLDQIVKHQVSEGPPKLKGALAQNSFGSHKIEKYFPIYNARCVSALLQGYKWTNDTVYLECALEIMRFIAGWVNFDGSLPIVIYANAKPNPRHTWIAPLGDVLRAAQEIKPYGFEFDTAPILQRLLAGQDASGGIQTAQGFAGQAGRHYSAKTPDLRDVLHVAGWCDKAFRFLAGQVSGLPLPAMESQPFETTCIFRGQSWHLLETPTLLNVQNKRGNVCYQWEKGQNWAKIATSEFWLR